jgi:signal transduction histidine kinase
VPVVVSFLVQVPAALLRGRPRSWFTDLPADPAQFIARLALALVGPVALVFARRFPGPTVAVVSAAAGAYVLVVSGDMAPPYIALAFAIVGAVVRGARVWAWCSIAAAWAVTLTLGIVLQVPWQPALVVAVSLALVLFVAVGESIRSRRRRFDELRRRAAEARVSEAQAERVRIARELHDVLAHSLSAISVQAGVGLHLIETRPEEAAKALADIKATSRSALDEVRSVLGVLRDGAPDAAAGAPGEPAPLVPEPDLARLPALLESVRAHGVAVTLDDGLAPDAPVPRPTQLALYRIVQESLTNVTRHSPWQHVHVALADTDAAYRVTIVDGPSAVQPSAAQPSAVQPAAVQPAAVQPADGGAGRADVVPTGAEWAGAHRGGGPATTGRGIIGMQERAVLLGGTLDAGPTADGGFAVVADLPKRRLSADHGDHGAPGPRSAP